MGTGGGLLAGGVVVDNCTGNVFITPGGGAGGATPGGRAGGGYLGGPPTGVTEPGSGLDGGGIAAIMELAICSFVGEVGLILVVMCSWEIGVGFFTLPVLSEPAATYENTHRTE